MAAEIEAAERLEQQLALNSPGHWLMSAEDLQDLRVVLATLKRYKRLAEMDTEAERG